MARCATLTGQHVYRMPQHWWDLDGAIACAEMALAAGCDVCQEQPSDEDRVTLLEMAQRIIDSPPTLEVTANAR